jgi:hypothetical protein
VETQQHGDATMSKTIQPADFDADSVAEFAARNRISRSQVYNEINAGRLTASKIGTRTIITREDGAAWRSQLPKLTPTGTKPAEPAAATAS